MLKKILFILISFLIATNTACSTAETVNTNVNGETNSTNMNPPPGFSASPLPLNGEPIPGIPDPNSANANSLPKGATPTPGIPDEKSLGKPLPKGATPTPGIPDEATRKKQMESLSNSSKKEQKSPSMNSNSDGNATRKF